jgi:hypothetical protein
MRKRKGINRKDLSKTISKGKEGELKRKRKMTYLVI